MAKNVTHIQHLRSTVVENNKAKLPSPNALADGEIAINYADGYEALAIKNSSGEVVQFSSDDAYTEILNGKLDKDEFDAYSGRVNTSLANKVNTSTYTAYTSSTQSTINGKQDEISDLSSIRASAATKSDWNAVSGVAQILNKPTIPDGLPSVTSSDNGKILMVVNGTWTLVLPATLYSGSAMPANSQGNNGDIFVES